MRLETGDIKHTGEAQSPILSKQYLCE